MAASSRFATVSEDEIQPKILLKRQANMVSSPGKYSIFPDKNFKVFL